MADPNEITIEQRGGNSGAGHAVEREQRSRVFRTTGDLSDIENGPGLFDGIKKEGRRESEKDTERWIRENPSPNSEHLYAQSYERHRNGAEAFTKDFVKTRDQDLNITLIAAGLLSTVTSAFILYIQPQLRADPNEESAALLRVLLYKTDNTTFGGDVPEVPRWTGPPITTVVALLLLYLSLAGTLGATLFAILAKQLLNLYASAGTSRSNLEGGRTRGRRLRWFAAGLHATVFLLSFMLQIALFLLGCALTVYIWNISRLIASFSLLTTILAISFSSFLLLFGLADVGYSHYLRSREDDVNATSSETNLARIARYFRPCS